MLQITKSLSFIILIISLFNACTTDSKQNNEIPKKLSSKPKATVIDKQVTQKTAYEPTRKKIKLNLEELIKLFDNRSDVSYIKKFNNDLMLTELGVNVYQSMRSTFVDKKPLPSYTMYITNTDVYPSVAIKIKDKTIWEMLLDEVKKTSKKVSTKTTQFDEKMVTYHRENYEIDTYEPITGVSDRKSYQIYVGLQEK